MWLKWMYACFSCSNGVQQKGKANGKGDRQEIDNGNGRLRCEDEKKEGVMNVKLLPTKGMEWNSRREGAQAQKDVKPGRPNTTMQRIKEKSRMKDTKRMMYAGGDEESQK